MHGGADGSGRPIKHGIYSKVTHPKLRELLDAAAELEDPLDLEPHVLMLQALTADFVERYSEVTSALVAWHASYSAEYQAELRAWRKRRDETPDDEDEPTPVGSGKPAQVLDISAASILIDKVGAMVERIEKRREKGVIRMSAMRWILQQHGLELESVVNEMIHDGDMATKLLDAVETRWDRIPLEPPRGAEEVE